MESKVKTRKAIRRAHEMIMDLNSKAKRHLKIGNIVVARRYQEKIDILLSRYITAEVQPDVEAGVNADNTSAVEYLVTCMS